MFGKKKDEYKEGFKDGEESMGKRLNSEFNTRIENIKLHYEGIIADKNFEIKRLMFKGERIQAENKKIRSDIIEARKLYSDAEQKEREVQNFKDDFKELLKQEERIRLEPLQIIGKMIDNLETPKQKTVEQIENK